MNIGLLFATLFILVIFFRWLLRPKRSINELIWILSDGGQNDLELQWEEDGVQMELKLRGKKEVGR